jgi:hypothetical protein
MIVCLLDEADSQKRSSRLEDQVKQAEARDKEVLERFQALQALQDALKKSHEEVQGRVQTLKSEQEQAEARNKECYQIIQDLSDNTRKFSQVLAGELENPSGQPQTHVGWPAGPTATTTISAPTFTHRPRHHVTWLRRHSSNNSLFPPAAGTGGGRPFHQQQQSCKQRVLRPTAGRPPRRSELSPQTATSAVSQIPKKKGAKPTAKPGGARRQPPPREARDARGRQPVDPINLIIPHHSFPPTCRFVLMSKRTCHDQ